MILSIKHGSEKVILMCCDTLVGADFVFIGRPQGRFSLRGAGSPTLIAMTMGVLQLDIVVPVRNEERDLAPSVRRLVAYLRAGFPFTARVTIADNGSTDGTWAIADRLAREFDEVRAVRMEEPGRGRALRAIWSTSDAESLACMDVGLS